MLPSHQQFRRVLVTHITCSGLAVRPLHCRHTSRYFFRVRIKKRGGSQGIKRGGSQGIIRSGNVVLLSCKLLTVRVAACHRRRVRGRTTHAAQSPIDQLGSMHSAVSFKRENNVVAFDIL